KESLAAGLRLRPVPWITPGQSVFFPCGRTFASASAPEDSVDDSRLPALGQAGLEPGAARNAVLHGGRGAVSFRHDAPRAQAHAAPARAAHRRARAWLSLQSLDLPADGRLPAPSRHPAGAAFRLSVDAGRRT